MAGLVETQLGQADPAIVRIMEFAAEEIVPRLAGTSNELTAVLHALDGGFVPAGPSGSPLRGLINVLPTGRNFYSVDPKAVPSRLAYDTGQAMAESLIDRYRKDTGDYPRSVGLSVWGTSAMRTAGDDIAEVLALIGVAPVWDEASRRVTDLTVIAAWTTSAAPGSTSPSGFPGFSGTPSRTWSPCWTTRCGWSPTWTSRTS